MSNPTRFLNGVATVTSSNPLGNYPLPDPFHTSGSTGKDVVTYSNDFMDLGNAASRTTTGVSSTFALTEGVGGIGILTPGGTTTASSIYRTAAAFQFIAGNKFWFIQRVKYSAVGTGITGYFGMIKTGAATTDSLLFKLDATGVVSFVSTVNNVPTTLLTTVTTATAGGWLDLAFYFDGTDILVYSSDVVVGRISGASIGSASTTLTNAILTPITQITPAATETVSLDYTLVAQETIR